MQGHLEEPRVGPGAEGARTWRLPGLWLPREGKAGKADGLMGWFPWLWSTEADLGLTRAGSHAESVGGLWGS